MFFDTAIPKAQFTVKLSLIGTVVAVFVSVFNVVEAGPNEFDPQLLERELDRRKLKLLFKDSSSKRSDK